MNRIKDKNHMIMSIGTEKALEKYNTHGKKVTNCYSVRKISHLIN